MIFGKGFIFLTSVSNLTIQNSSTLPCNMLSYVEHYEPDYFLLENVAGLLDHRLLDKRTTKGGVNEDYEIQSGMVKIILRTLIALGYDNR